jgi:hypothetical protein
MESIPRLLKRLQIQAQMPEMHTLRTIDCCVVLRFLKRKEGREVQVLQHHRHPGEGKNVGMETFIPPAYYVLYRN